MARARLLKPGFFENEHLAELPFEARLLFAGLWTIADRRGRLEDRPKRIKAVIFPYDEGLLIDDFLAQLATAGFIERYQVNGQNFIWIPTFETHQRPNINEPESVLPPSPNEQGSPNDQPMIDHRGIKLSESKSGSKSKSKSGDGSGSTGGAPDGDGPLPFEPSADELAEPDPEPPKQRRRPDVSDVEPLLPELCEQFDTVDVMYEWDQFRDYCASSTKAKYKDYPAAFRNWLRREEKNAKPRQPAYQANGRSQYADPRGPSADEISNYRERLGIGKFELVLDVES